MARTYKATIRCRDDSGILIQPSLHYQTDVSVVGSEPDPNDVAAGIWAIIRDHFIGATPLDVTIDELVVGEEVLKPAIGASGSHPINVQGSFSTSGDRMPNACVAVLNRHTATRSRSARGWLMMPGGILADQQANGLWHTDGGYWTAWLVPLAALLDNSFDLGSVDPTHVNPVVYSRTRHQRGDSPYTFRVTNATANPQVRWLKSRLTIP